MNRSVVKNAALNAAAVAKNDEFYTRIPDIEKELSHYSDQFRDKIVYCNCDDPTVSNFFKYFSMKFADPGLKKLITTCYRNQNLGLFSQHDVERAIKLEYDGFRDGEHVPNVEDIGVRPQIMRDVDWGPLHAQHRGDALDAPALEEEIGRLVSLGGRGRTSPIRKLSGVYAYALDGDERHLNLRTFDNAQKTAAYERQGGKCADCGKGFEFRQMEGDHITPWKDGGLTDDDNLQMLCKSCNRSKGAR